MASTEASEAAHAQAKGAGHQGPARGGALRRMVRPAQPVRKPAEVVDAGGLREAAPRVVNRVAGVSVSLGRHGVDTMAREDVAEALPEGALVFRLQPAADDPSQDDGEGRPAPARGVGGLGWLSADLFTAIVERRLTGVVRQQACAPRAPTPLDAVICSELIDGLCGADGVGGGMRMRTRDYLPEPDLSVALADMPYRVLRLTLSIARAAGRGGEIGLVLPDHPRHDAREAEDHGPVAGVKRPDLLTCHADLRAVLPPLVLPWARLTRMAPGELIELPDGALDGVRVEGIDGVHVGLGRLGRFEGSRAVRLVGPLLTPPDADDASDEPAGVLPLDLGGEAEEGPDAEVLAVPIEMEALADEA